MPKPCPSTCTDCNAMRIRLHECITRMTWEQLDHLYRTIVRDMPCEVFERPSGAQS